MTCWCEKGGEEGSRYCIQEMILCDMMRSKCNDINEVVKDKSVAKKSVEIIVHYIYKEMKVWSKLWNGDETKNCRY